MLDDEFDRDRDEVLLADIEALTTPSAASTLDEELERLLELVLSAANTASTLEDEELRLSDEV